MTLTSNCSEHGKVDQDLACSYVAVRMARSASIVLGVIDPFRESDDRQGVAIPLMLSEHEAGDF
jgi:hypothetical protein